jgi:hypothetical protein
MCTQRYKKHFKPQNFSLYFFSNFIKKSCKKTCKFQKNVLLLWCEIVYKKRDYTFQHSPTNKQQTLQL